jgi:type II secretory pathway pseudopilin PulG
VRRLRSFTLVEIVLAISILMLLLLLAVPSLHGVFTNKRLKSSLDGFNNLVREAQQRSITERRSYLIVWRKDNVVLRPETFAKGEEIKPTAHFQLGRDEALKLLLPAALTKKYPAEWIFWPSGACEPATVQFQGPAGSWTANYLPLGVQPELIDYAAR